MKAAAGAFLDRHAYAGILLVFVLGGLTFAGVLLLSGLTSGIIQRRGDTEEAMLRRLEKGFRTYVSVQGTIPGTGTWSTAIASASGLNLNQVEYVHPDFVTDPTIRRVLLIDDLLNTNSLLPYAQTTAGLTGSQTNFLQPRARMMIVSSAKRGLALPVSTGFLTQSAFDAIWNWTCNPSTQAPPAGWPASWTGNGEFLHVKPIYLPSLFHTLSFENLQYSVNSTNQTTVTSQANRYLLRGSLLKIFFVAGNLHQARVILRDETFSLPATSTTNLYYFSGNGIPTDTDGVPCAGFTNAAPTASTLPNYDPGRDAFAGLLVAKGGSGASESDSTKIQKWITASGSFTISGTASLTIYSAMKDFDTTKRGTFVAYLVECNADGSSPTTVASVTLNRNDWDVANTGTWIADTVSFGAVSRSIPSNKRLGVSIIVHNDSHDDMWFAYGTTNYNSRLTIY